MKIFSFFIFVLISGCSSYTNLNSGGGGMYQGGYYEDQISESAYRLTARSATSPFGGKSSAQKTFDRRAQELCPNGYRTEGIIEGKEDQGVSMGELKYLVYQIQGFIYCKDKKI